MALFGFADPSDERRLSGEYRESLRHRAKSKRWTLLGHECRSAKHRFAMLVRSFHRRNAQPADPIRIFKNWPLRYWTQAFLGYLDEAAAESNHKFADL
jgi:hypothetical protein